MTVIVTEVICIRLALIIYKISGGTLNGCKIGFTSNKMIVTGNSSLNGNYAKTATYEMP